MSRYLCGAAAGCVVLALSSGAMAHGIAGPREFPATLTIDDPAVGDELSFPTVTSDRVGSDDVTPVPGWRQTTTGFEWDKTITENFGFGIADDWQHRSFAGDTADHGWDSLEATLKYRALVIPEHEFMVSVGISREFGKTGTTTGPANGAAAIGDTDSTTTPTLYFGKGLGDLPIGYLRPLAITGTFGYAIPDQPNADPKVWQTGLSLQYSIPYLQSEVKDLGLPSFIAGLTPVVEVNFTSPSSGVGSGPPTGTIAPGVLYSAATWQFGVEALLPINRATNQGVGAIAQFHLFFDDLFPNSLGKPLFGGKS